MPLVTTREMFAVAGRERFAIGAFNMSSLEAVQAITEVAAEEASPVMLQVCPVARKYLTEPYIVKLVEAALMSHDIPIALNLDHGLDFETAKSVIDAGFTSVMIDGSKGSFADNVALTRRVVEYAHSKGVPVEAELGKIGGAEAGLDVATKEAGFTDPGEAERFVKESGCDSLAIAIGTAHGAYKFKGEPRLDFERLAEIERRLPGFPLVLHGASSVPQGYVSLCNEYGGELPGAKGVPEEMIAKASRMGIRKVNINTDLTLAFTGHVRKFLEGNRGELEPREYCGAGREVMREIVREKLRVLGSAGKAGAVMDEVEKSGG